MRLSWSIKKKRGNWRPLLTYTAEAEEWEEDLAINGGASGVTCICSGDYYENKAPVQGVEYKDAEGKRHLTLPCNNGKSKIANEFRLPWRPGARPEYPEVEAAMAALMAEWERRVLVALDSGPLNLTGEGQHSEAFKAAVVAYATARKMLGDKADGL